MNIGRDGQVFWPPKAGKSQKVGRFGADIPARATRIGVAGALEMPGCAKRVRMSGCPTHPGSLDCRNPGILRKGRDVSGNAVRAWDVGRSPSSGRAGRDPGSDLGSTDIRFQLFGTAPRLERAASAPVNNGMALGSAFRLGRMVLRPTTSGILASDRHDPIQPARDTRWTGRFEREEE